MEINNVVQLRDDDTQLHPESFDTQLSNENLPFQFPLLASLVWWPPESERWTFHEALRWDDVVLLDLFIVCCLSTVKLLDEWDTKTGSFEWVQKHLNLRTPQVDTIQNALLNKSIPIYVETLRNMDISSLALNLRTLQVDNNQNALLIKSIPIYVKILRNMDISFTIDNSLWINSLALRFVKVRPNSLRFTKIRPISTIEFNLNFIHLLFSSLLFYSILFSSLIMSPTGFGFEFTNTASWHHPECVTH